MIEIGQGCECTVYDVGDGMVFKSYIQLHLSYGEKVKYARICFELQSIAAEQGLAPQAIKVSGTGYYSEKVKEFGNPDNDERFENLIISLCEKIDQLFGTGWFDCRDDNLGILPNGDLCVIDFGLLGFTRTKTGSDLMAKHSIERY